MKNLPFALLMLLQMALGSIGSGHAGENAGDLALATERPVEFWENKLAERVGSLALPLIAGHPRFAFRIRVETEDLLPRPLPGGVPTASETKPTHSFDEILVGRSGPDSWFLEIRSAWKNVAFNRDASATRLLLPGENVEFFGEGNLASLSESLEPEGLLARVMTHETRLSAVLPFLVPGSSELAIRQFLIPNLGPMTTGDPGSSRCAWEIRPGVSLALDLEAQGIRLEAASLTRDLKSLKAIEIELLPATFAADQTSFSALKITRTPVPRVDLEKSVIRGARQLLRSYFPSRTGIPLPETTDLPNGMFRLNDGQPVVLLWGSPFRMGRAYGKLLESRIPLTIDAVLYLSGLIETVNSGKWFLGELDQAWNRARPFIPGPFIQELEGIASSCPSVSLRELQLANIFPEYFHCAGFAVFGKATLNGNLFHGRVLDYMPEIGLQNAAVNFVFRPRERNAFFNVGFAGFIGCVTGINDKGVAIGSLGGQGYYDWDGTPMSFLVRRALEECDSASGTRELIASSPRTCHYYYLVSDGKIPTALAVEATPHSFEELGPGAANPFLGEGITDSIILAAPQFIRWGVREKFGKLGEDEAKGLMGPPVATRTNVHSVLFAPQKLEAHVAHADMWTPAGSRPFVFFDLKTLFGLLPRPRPPK